MPIIPPSLPWIRAAADRMLDPLLEIAAASYVPPKPMPEPLDYCGVIIDNNTGDIEQITDASTASALSELRNKIISTSNGAKGMTIVEAAVGKQCKPGQPASRLLDILEANQRAGYELYLSDKQYVRF
jgi:hypothetical protein